MKKFAAVLKAAVCSAAGILIMTGCTSYVRIIDDEPHTYVAIASENTAASMVKDSFSEEYKLFSDALKDGTFSLEFEAEGIKFNGECYVNEKEDISSQLYTLTGSKGTTAQIYAFADKNSMKIGTKGKSGTHIYNFDMATLEKKLASSIFSPDSDSDYALSQQDYDMFLQYAAEINSAVKGETSESSAYSEYIDIINKYLKENPPVVTKNSKATINGEDVKANVIKYNISKKDLKSLIGQLVDVALEQNTIPYTEYGYTKEEYKADFMEELNELDNYSIQLVYYVNSKTNVLMQSDIAVNISEDDTKCRIDLKAVYGVDPAKAKKQSFTLKIKMDYPEDSYYDDEEVKITANVTRSKNKTEIAVKLTEDGETEELTTIVCEKDGKNYSVTAKIPDLEATAGMTGTVVKDKNSFKMTIDKLFLTSGSTELSYYPKAVISVKKGGEALNLDAKKDFLDITEKEMDTLLENIEADFSAVFDEFAEDSTMGKYIRKSKISSANSYAKMVNTALQSNLTKTAIDGKKIKGSVIDGKGSSITIDGKKVDLSDYLGDDFTGYIYAVIDPESYSTKYVLWSEKAIPKKYKHQLTSKEQETIVSEGTAIGCYPLK